MVIRARRGERTRHGEQHHLPRAEDVTGPYRLRALFTHDPHFDVGYAVTYGNAHDTFPSALDPCAT